MRRITAIVLSSTALLLACTAEQDSAEDTTASQGSPLTPASQSGLKVDDMLLAMAQDGSGVLSLALDANEQKRVSRENQGATFSLSANPKEKAIIFNDLGKAPDAKAGDGLFTASIPLSIEKLTALNREIAQLKSGPLYRFAPGSRLVSRREEFSQTNAIDLTALKRGATIRLPILAELGPLKTLGAVTTASINPQKSLLIRSLPVIEDPTRTMNPCDTSASNTPLKKWTFGHLMEQMAQGSGLTPSAFVEQWLNSWRTQQIVNASGGGPVLDATSAAALANIDSLIINPWRQRSGGGALDLSIAPFRLQAIVYRSDLAQSSPYGGSTKGNNAGELRFVFGAMEVRDQNNDGDASDPGDTCQVIEAATIFEYGVPLSTCNDIKNWANSWVNLSTMLPGDPAYNAALEALTESVVQTGAAPGKANQNALNQLRTNEIDLTGIWQLREFVITPGNGPLMQTTTKNQPREHQVAFTSVAGTTPTPINLNGSPLLLNEIIASMSPGYVMQELSGGAPFMGGASTYNFNTFWDHPSLSTAAELEARFQFSSKTCSGCHTGETQTTFYHIRPVGPGASPTLSNFLQVSPLTVSDNHGLSHTFAEMDNRKQALANLANQSCSLFGGLPPFQLQRVALVSTE